ncbi:AraC family transcriptional regulator with amidase-like domain [Edaphobacter aggregans]|uniref:AraC family transcriptional regulator with amidase-like domain n=1 Tax=Edaphobacter aggregans TaxID=570835 RepID=A0A3R9P1Q9_9BACT|nr:transcriptional regulator FtrA [Edaphobacter aggregans]RSL19108.1 AraC family transcriptional regulator with amidase-like domain [Edaphobacter aggregans]
MPIIVKNVPRRSKTASRPLSLHRVATLAYKGLCTFEFGIVVELFGLPRPELDHWYDFEVCGLEKGPLQATGGISVLPKKGLEGLMHADTILIPGWRDPDELPPQRLIRTLIAAHRKGVRLVSICSGIFVLAATGLLNGRRATTHWKYVDKLRSAFPLIQLQPDVLYVDDGDILTSAGSAAGIDLCLHIIRNDFGTLIANKVARRLVVSPHREGGQAQFIDKPIGDQTSPWLAHLLEWVQVRLHNSITVEQLASQARMSKRTLSRRFAETTGSSPLDWITTLRVRRAKDLLETSALSVEEVADRCGFGSAPTLRHHFRTRVKLTPNSYRARFQRSA